MKKLSLLIAAATAILAFAIPSTASAALATCPAGTTCPKGTQITLTGTNFALDTELVGKLFCKGLTVNAEITKNESGVVEGKGPEETNPTQVECYNEEQSRPIKITHFKVNNLTDNASTGPAGTSKAGTVSFVVQIDLFNTAVCTFTASTIPITYISGASPDVITPMATTKTITSTGGCGKAQLTGSFTIEKKGTTTPVVVD